MITKVRLVLVSYPSCTAYCIKRQAYQHNGLRLRDRPLLSVPEDAEALHFGLGSVAAIDDSRVCILALKRRGACKAPTRRGSDSVHGTSRAPGVHGRFTGFRSLSAANLTGESS